MKIYSEIDEEPNKETRGLKQNSSDRKTDRLNVPNQTETLLNPRGVCIVILPP